MTIVKVDSVNFEQEVLQSQIPVLVDFYADWCGPCKMLSPIVDEVAEQTVDVKVCKLNVDEAGDIAARYGVMSIPTLIVFRGGDAVKRSVGLIGKADVLQLIG